MDTTKPWLVVAELMKAKNNEGGLSVRATEGLPFLLEEGMEVVFVPPILRFPRSSCVSEVIEQSPDRYLVYFDDVADRNDAEKLEGHYCLVKRSALPESLEDETAFDVVGYRLVDETAGDIGPIKAIEENPAHPLLVVARQSSGDGSDGSYDLLVPLVEDFIVSIDEDSSVVFVDLPAGLLDL